MTAERLNIIRAQIEAYEFACREGCFRCQDDLVHHDCFLPDSRARLETLREQLAQEEKP